MQEELILVHHGIKGQKWGIKNGPPYPLDASQKSSAEKNHTRKVDSESGEKKKYWTNERKATAKKIAKGAAITAAVILAAYGGYKLSKISGSNNSGKMVGDLLSAYGGTSISRVGKSADQIDSRMVGSINANNTGPDGARNCAHTSIAYILNSVFGKNVTAQGFNGVDEASGLKRDGRSKQIFDVAFSGIKHTDFGYGVSFDDALPRIPSNSTGVLFINVLGSGHFLNYECDRNGLLTIVDSQQPDAEHRIMRQGSAAFEFVKGVSSVLDIMDFSEADIRDDADSVLRYCVQGRY